MRSLNPKDEISTIDLELRSTSESDPFEALVLPSSSRQRQIWAIGGGKGGVGKSLITSSLCIALARQSYRVVAVDLDLGGANLHTTLGVEIPRKTLSDFLTGKESTLEACMSPTGIPRLELVSGALDAVRAADITFKQKVRLMQGILELDADYIILDLGAGTNLHTTDFFLLADLGLVTMLPEPTSIENIYRFIKSAYYRRLWLSPELKPIRSMIETLTGGTDDLGIRNPSELFREVSHSNPAIGMALKEQISQFRPKLIVNQARTQTDIDIGTSVKTVCKRYFGIEMDYVGYLDHDSSVWQAVRRKRPLMLEFPNSRLVSSFERVSQFLLRRYADSHNELIDRKK